MAKMIKCSKCKEEFGDCRCPDKWERRYGQNTLQKSDALLKKTKSKNTSILLAIFLGVWAWVYTFEEDSTKFWIGMILIAASVITAGLSGVASWIWAVVEISSHSDEKFKPMYKWV
jgi:hypothetical protein